MHYSVITRCELFAGPEEQEDAVRALLAPFGVGSPSMPRSLSSPAGFAGPVGVRTPDALIGATALAGGLTLITRNLADFEPIPRLRVRAP